jgi:hypothetical protein
MNHASHNFATNSPCEMGELMTMLAIFFDIVTTLTLMT